MKVNYTLGSCQMKPKKFSHKVVAFNYANGKNHKIYLDISEKVARKRFEKYMNARTAIEVDIEGWEAIVHRGYMQDNELHIETNIGEVFGAINDAIGLAVALAELQHQQED